MSERTSDLTTHELPLAAHSSGKSFVTQTKPEREVLRLRIVRGPLQAHENESILSQYNQLSGANIPAQEFLHWVQGGPEGPAWHAILETNAAEIVGHTSLIPFQSTYNGRQLIPAKSEYSFIREEFRASKIDGFQKSGQLRNLIYIDQLFRRCRSEGWGPLFISTTIAVHRVFRSVGCYPLDLPVLECLLVLQPWKAAHETPNLHKWQRAALGAAGVFQCGAWFCGLLLSPRPAEILSVPLDRGSLPVTSHPLSFFQDPASLRWRYLESQYERLKLNPDGDDFLIVKKGSADRYLRVCQWHLSSCRPSFPLIAALVRRAQEQRALGVRWAVYGNGEGTNKIAQALRQFGFLRARRTRTLLINAGEQEFLAPKNWGLTDAMFCFDP